MPANLPDEVAFACLDNSSTRPAAPTELTFAAWERTSNRLARGLSGAGVAKGDRVGIYVTADDALPWVVAYAGVHKAGAVAVPLNTRLTSTELSALLAHAEASVLVHSQELAETAEGLAAELSSLRLLLATGGPVWEEMLDDDDSAVQVPVGAGDLA